MAHMVCIHSGAPSQEACLDDGSKWQRTPINKKVLSLLLRSVGIMEEYLQCCGVDFVEICNSEVQGKPTS